MDTLTGRDRVAEAGGLLPLVRGHMARIRSIKPEFFVHEDITRLSALHRILFIGLWTQADREGRLEDRPRRLKVQVLPFDDCDIDAMLADLDREGFIHRYQVSGMLFIAIPSFLDHQRPRPDEPPSVIPASPERRIGARTQTLFDEEDNAADTDPTLRSDGSVPAECIGKEGKGEGKGEGEGSAIAVALTPKPVELMDVWNETVQHLPKAQRLTGQREKHASARLKDHPDLSFWRTVFARMDASPFCRGATGRGWRADFDFAIKPDTYAKVLEGKYDDRAAAPQATSTISDAEFRRAEMYRRSAYGRCPHDPKCGTYNACVASIAHDIRGKGAA